jgi:hypothetical protein
MRDQSTGHLGSQTPNGSTSQIAFQTPQGSRILDQDALYSKLPPELPVGDPASTQRQVLAFSDMCQGTHSRKAGSVRQSKSSDRKTAVLGSIAEAEKLCLESGLLLGHWTFRFRYWW